jgi:hypothetical protein
LNPIENLWAILKRRLYSEPGFPTSKAELIEKVFEKWDSIPVTICEHLVDSMPKRMKEVLKSHGYPIKY